MSNVAQFPAPTGALGSNKDRLRILAGEIKFSLNAAKKDDNRASDAKEAAADKRLDAGRKLIEARGLVERMQDNYWTWKTWCKNNLDCSYSYAMRLIKTASAADPEAALEETRRKDREAQQRSRLKVTDTSMSVTAGSDEPPAKAKGAGKVVPDTLDPKEFHARLSAAGLNADEWKPDITPEMIEGDRRQYTRHVAFAELADILRPEHAKDPARIERILGLILEGDDHVSPKLRGECSDTVESLTAYLGKLDKLKAALNAPTSPGEVTPS